MKIEGWFFGLSILLFLFFFLFALFYERNKLSTRNLFLYVILTSFCVLSRLAFFFIPHVKPMMAMCMMVSSIFGPSLGFLLTSLSVFTSNFFFGHGPWTLWQMLAFAFSSFLYGLFFYKNDRSSFMKALVSFFIYLFVTGPILDFYALLSMQSTLTLENVFFFFSMGFFFNLMQASTTFVVILTLEKSICRKLKRMKSKYEEELP